jgi:hypothetical protein
VEDEQALVRIVESARLVAEISLKRNDYTILTLVTPVCRPIDLGVKDARQLGIAIGDITLEPV